MVASKALLIRPCGTAENRLFLASLPLAWLRRLWRTSPEYCQRYNATTTTTLPAVPPPSEDGAGASAADAPDADMLTVTDAAPTAGNVTSTTRGQYSTVDAAYLRRRNQRRKARQHDRHSRR